MTNELLTDKTAKPVGAANGPVSKKKYTEKQVIHTSINTILVCSLSDFVVAITMRLLVTKESY